MRTKTIAGRKVLEARENACLTQKELAQLLAAELDRSVHHTTISKIENGHDQCGVQFWNALAQVLRVDRDALLEEVPA